MNDGAPIPKGSRFIVCGGRRYHDVAAINAALDLLHARVGIAAIFQGGADGADLHAFSWARDHEIPVGTFNADWEKHGRKAGAIRNAEMLSESGAEGVVAFPGGAGTADMIARAEAAGIKVWRPYG